MRRSGASSGHRATPSRTEAPQTQRPVSLGQPRAQTAAPVRARRAARTRRTGRPRPVTASQAVLIAGGRQQRKTVDLDPCVRVEARVGARLDRDHQIAAIPRRASSDSNTSDCVRQREPRGSGASIRTTALPGRRPSPSALPFAGSHEPAARLRGAWRHALARERLAPEQPQDARVLARISLACEPVLVDRRPTRRPRRRPVRSRCTVRPGTGFGPCRGGSEEAGRASGTPPGEPSPTRNAAETRLTSPSAPRRR